MSGGVVVVVVVVVVVEEAVRTKAAALGIAAATEGTVVVMGVPGRHRRLTTSREPWRLTRRRAPARHRLLT